MHEQGMADHELVDESERDKFADVMSTPARSRRRRPHDGRPRPRRAAPRRGHGTRMESEGGATSSDYEQGREDERRFERNRITDDVRESERR